MLYTKWTLFQKVTTICLNTMSGIPTGMSENRTGWSVCSYSKLVIILVGKKVVSMTYTKIRHTILKEKPQSVFVRHQQH